MKLAFALLTGSLLVSGFTSVHAGLTNNGVKLNGMSMNGVKLNGMSLNGVKLNGLSLNGVKLNSLSFNGVKLNGQNLNTAGNGNSAIKLVGIILPEDEK